jgi:hypothetical protein
MKCFSCGREMSSDDCAFWIHDKKLVVCIGCEWSTIEVYKVYIPGDGSFLAEKDVSAVMSMIEEMDPSTSYLIEKTEMKTLKYLSLPEFQGF